MDNYIAGFGADLVKAAAPRTVAEIIVAEVRPWLPW
jgi:hypothetical protein